MIGRIGDRRTFDRLTRDGRQAKSETLWCTYLNDPDTVPPRVAFSIGRSVGSAVTRNRLRRQLRAIVGATAGRPPLTCGLMLVGARPSATELSFDELRDDVRRLLGRIR